MNIYEVLFLIQFFVIIVLILIKTNNLLHLGETYDLKMAILLFVGFILAWGVSFVVSMLSYQTIIYSVLFKLETWLLLLNLGFLLAELIMYFVSHTAKPIDSYKSSKSRDRYRSDFE